MWVDEDGILLSGATARRHSQPGWLGWTLKDGSGLWQCEVDFRTVRAWRGIERPRHTLCETRLLCRCQLCVEKLALRLGRSRRSRAFVHSLRNSCAFAACVRPLHTSMFILLIERVLRGLEPTQPAGRAARRRRTSRCPFRKDTQLFKRTHGFSREYPRVNAGAVRLMYVRCQSDSEVAKVIAVRGAPAAYGSA